MLVRDKKMPMIYVGVREYILIGLWINRQWKKKKMNEAIAYFEERYSDENISKFGS